MRPIFFVLLLIAHSPLFAQEFGLEVVAKGSDPDIERKVTFGYDPVASDSFSPEDEAAYGELEYPPGDPGLLFRMVGGPERGLTISQDGGKVDIRRKPALDSFMLPFRMALQSGEAGHPVTLRWDRTKIPAIIRHITLSSPVDPFSRTIDMKLQDTMMVNEGEKNSFRNVAVRLYYNMEVPTATVNELEKSIAIFPNPLTANSIVALVLEEPSTVSITVVDITGRQVLTHSVRCAAGSNAIPLGAQLSSQHGPLFARITIRDAHGAHAVTRTLIAND